MSDEREVERMKRREELRLLYEQDEQEAPDTNWQEQTVECCCEVCLRERGLAAAAPEIEKALLAPYLKNINAD